jgi:hypothetical protein
VASAVAKKKLTDKETLAGTTEEENMTGEESWAVTGAGKKRL